MFHVYIVFYLNNRYKHHRRLRFGPVAGRNPNRFQIINHLRSAIHLSPVISSTILKISDLSIHYKLL